jgi:hypothetical protein
MDWKEVIKKYGVWIVGFALVGYLVYRQTRGGSSAPRLLPPAPPGAPGFSADQYRLESERLRAAGALDLERDKLNASIEAARRRADIDRFNAEAQEAARRRALDAQGRQQTIGLIGQILGALSGLLGGKQTPQKAPTPSVGTPPTFPGGGRTQPSSAPYYAIPAPNINVLYDPNYMPAFPEPAPEYMQLRVDDWGEAPSFEMAGLGLDSGATFYNDYYGADYGGDFNYGYGYDQGGFSDLPYVSEQTYDYYGSGYSGDDFYYGYGAGDYGGGGYQYDVYSDSGSDDGFVYAGE